MFPMIILNRILDEREGKEVDLVKSEACVLLSHIMYMMIKIIKIGPIFKLTDVMIIIR